ncbi:preprotein translocase subunit SecG [Cochlodiniinecator piscidefendens]|uniref:preprotein translocase subunit SecG n=1 Tax=Cochlodiniinecator piscidefendens TaxID=2715756 RepID=UPI00140DAB83|nr:preprotein translocase subunit SecG [Cochlodiniinecator piscidefendens]
MENVIFVVYLILAVCLIGAVLMQRSEGGGLGMGSGGGAGGGAMSSRSAATALGKLTWLLAIGFFATAIALTVIASSNAGGGSVLDNGEVTVDDSVPSLPNAEDLLPPSTGEISLTPPSDSE